MAEDGSAPLQPQPQELQAQLTSTLPNMPELRCGPVALYLLQSRVGPCHAAVIDAVLRLHCNLVTCSRRHIFYAFSLPDQRQHGSNQDDHGWLLEASFYRAQDLSQHPALF